MGVWLKQASSLLLDFLIPGDLVGCLTWVPHVIPFILL